MSTEYKLRVRYSDTSAQKFVYHANYFAWMDTAQSEFLRKNGISIKELEEKGIRFMPLDVKCKYYAPAYFEDELTITLRVVGLSNVKTHLEYDIVRDGDGATIAKCAASYAIMSENFRPLVMKNALPELYELLKKTADEQK